MKIVVASSNKGKIKEIQDYLNEFEVIAYTDLLEKTNIEENADTFKENAIIKANEIYKKLKDRDDIIVLSDDSGISVPALGNIPGIYSARFAGENASDKDNLDKLIKELKDRGIKKTKAFYTCAIALATKEGTFTVHGWLYGEVIDEARGDNGFGYDPMFIPYGYDKTVGELPKEEKEKFSHRTKALKLAKILLKTIKG
ncbi:MAG: RdgB/HAM1 family non-canonical purine NTP pyrophosphatase [Epsilonproteobacteria bacterium]|nr:RdgB/HAM1 family non-canonical purine NTP pyrophosphatase [Campylobacterota bacterium]